MMRIAIVAVVFLSVASLGNARRKRAVSVGQGLCGTKRDKAGDIKVGTVDECLDFCENWVTGCNGFSFSASLKNCKAYRGGPYNETKGLKTSKYTCYVKGCYGNEFKCKSRDCIKSSERCNGKYECDDGENGDRSDEENCPTKAQCTKHDDCKDIPGKKCINMGQSDAHCGCDSVHDDCGDLASCWLSLKRCRLDSVGVCGVDRTGDFDYVYYNDKPWQGCYGCNAPNYGGGSAIGEQEYIYGCDGQNNCKNYLCNQECKHNAQGVNTGTCGACQWTMGIDGKCFPGGRVIELHEQSGGAANFCNDHTNSGHWMWTHFGCDQM